MAVTTKSIPVSRQENVAEEEIEEEEEDYMSMTIPTPKALPQKETYTQRRLRKQREAEDRSRPKSKAELKLIEDAAREDALAKPLFSQQSLDERPKSKALGMMARMGFKLGEALGKEGAGRAEPIGISMKEGRGGIGLDEEKKRKFREETAESVKRVKAEEGDYRERVRKEREDGRLEGLVGAAMRVAERMDGEKEERNLDGTRDVHGNRRIGAKPLKSINVLWRGLVRRREEKERDRRIRYDFDQSLSRLPTYDDENEDDDDRRALNKETIRHALVEDLEEEDIELEEFNTLEPTERLKRLVEHLRHEHRYCFWCKYTYIDEEMDGCPGLSEEDHD